MEMFRFIFKAGRSTLLCISTSVSPRRVLRKAVPYVPLQNAGDCRRTCAIPVFIKGPFRES